LSHISAYVDLPRRRSGITLAEFSRATHARLFRTSPVVRALLDIRLSAGERVESVVISLEARPLALAPTVARQIRRRRRRVRLRIFRRS
jgi:hypothetical protein